MGHEPLKGAFKALVYGLKALNGHFELSATQAVKGASKL
jgi:hypothetical protein